MAILDSLPWWMRPDARVEQLQDQIASLTRDLANAQQAVKDAYAGRDRDQAEHRRAMEAARREAYPLAGPCGYPTSAAQEIAALKAALRENADRLAAAEYRPIHEDRYTNWRVR